jgi:hypothetical protein
VTRAAVAAVLTGVLLVAYGATRLVGPRYWDPITAADYASVALFSVALLASGWAYLALARAAGGTPASIAALVGAVGAVVAAVANFGEDWLRLSALGPWFLAGVLPWGIGGIALGLSLALRNGWRVVAVAPAVTFLAFGVAEIGGSGIVGLAWIAAGLFIWRPRPRLMG